MNQNSRTQLLGALLVVAALCWFVIVIANRWMMHTLPTSNFVVFTLIGLTAVGAVFGVLICVFTNLLLRLGPPKLRVPLSAIAWLAVTALTLAALGGAGTDPHRAAIVMAVVAASGLLVGPLNAELLVGSWFSRRLASRQSSRS